jgi:hypothetical protein
MQIRTLAQMLALVLSGLIAIEPLSAQQQPAAPAKLNIVIVEGEGAVNNVRQRVAREPIVQVEDENRKPVAGAAVTFLLPNQGASASFANGARSLTIVTDNKGQAIARGLRPNGVNGNFQINVNASYGGQTASTTINMTNALAVGAATGAGISAKLIWTLVGVGAAAAAGGAIAATRNGNGNGGTPPQVSVGAGAPTVGAPR